LNPKLGQRFGGRAGRRLTDAVKQGDTSLKGSKPAVRRMFATIGFPLARLDS
jgi:hypothetical protein